MVTSGEKSLHEKLVEVALAIRNIEKGGKNEKQHYDFVKEADVVRAVMPEFLKRGILMYPNHRLTNEPQPFTTQNGSVQFLTTVLTTWTITDGKETLTTDVLGQGADPGDKGVFKAMTGDKKYAILQFLGIATGDDPENARPDEGEAAASPTKTAKKASAAQLNKMFAKAREAGYNLDDEEGKQAFVQSVFEWTGIRSSKDLENSHMDTIYTKLDDVKAVNEALDQMTNGDD